MASSNWKAAWEVKINHVPRKKVKTVLASSSLKSSIVTGKNQTIEKYGGGSLLGVIFQI